MDRETGNRRSEAIAMQGLAQVLLAEGGPDQALDLLRRAIALHQEVKSRVFEVYALTELAELLLLLDRRPEAGAAAMAAIDLAREIDEPDAIPIANIALAALARGDGDLDEAERLLDAAEEGMKGEVSADGVRVLVERGQLARARGASPSGLVLRAKEQLAAMELPPESPLGRLVAELEGGSQKRR
ncbi:MAG: hypothetical protein U0166_20385 [Acidobacteriota bacterium]